MQGKVEAVSLFSDYDRPGRETIVYEGKKRFLPVIKNHEGDLLVLSLDEVNASKFATYISGQTDMVVIDFESLTGVKDPLRTYLSIIDSERKEKKYVISLTSQFKPTSLSNLISPLVEPIVIYLTKDGSDEIPITRESVKDILKLSAQNRAHFYLVITK